MVLNYTSHKILLSLIMPFFIYKTVREGHLVLTSSYLTSLPPSRRCEVIINPRKRGWGRGRNNALNGSPTVRASNSLCMVPWSFTMPHSWMHFTKSSSCMYVFGSWKRFTAHSSCPFPKRHCSRSWSLFTRMMSRFSSGRLSACGEFIKTTSTRLIWSLCHKCNLMHHLKSKILII